MLYSTFISHKGQRMPSRWEVVIFVKPPAPKQPQDQEEYSCTSHTVVTISSHQGAAQTL